MTTVLEAIDDIYGRFKAAWDTTGLPCVYDNTPPDTALQAALDSGTTSWARTNIKHNTRTQLTLAGIDNARFESRGILIVEIYALSGDGLVSAYTLANTVLEAFEGVSTPNGVWFRNTRINEVGPDGVYFHTNVVTEFIYDTRRAD